MKKQIQVNEHIILRPWTVSMRKKERYEDPRYMQIDLDADYLITKAHPDTSIHSDRVMPLKNIKRFIGHLRRATKTLKHFDDSHFWVSGYYAIHFYLKSEKDRLKIKKLVSDAVNKSGGFMGFDTWYAQHNKKHCRIVQYNGTGSGIKQTYSNTPEHIAFL